MIKTRSIGWCFGWREWTIWGWVVWWIVCRTGGWTSRLRTWFGLCRGPRWKGAGSIRSDARRNSGGSSVLETGAGHRSGSFQIGSQEWNPVLVFALSALGLLVHLPDGCFRCRLIYRSHWCEQQLLIWVFNFDLLKIGKILKRSPISAPLLSRKLLSRWAIQYFGR